MITEIFVIPPILCYAIIAIGAMCMLYTEKHKDKYKVIGKYLVYGSVLADVIAGSIDVVFESALFPVVLFEVVEVCLLIAALIIEIRSAHLHGAVYVLGRFIVGSALGCIIVCFFAEIAVVALVAFITLLILVGGNDSGSDYIDEEDEFISPYINIDNNCYKIEDVQKESFSGRNIIELRGDGGTFSLRQDHEGSSTYHSSDGNSEYTRVGGSFIKH